MHVSFNFSFNLSQHGVILLILACAAGGLDNDNRILDKG